MKLTTILFILLSFSVVKALYFLEGETSSDIEFPTLDLPEAEFIDLSAGCSGFTDCTEYLANVIRNIGEGIITTILFIFELSRYMFELFLVVFRLQFEGFEGAPWWINVLFTTPFIMATALIIFRLFRSGDDEA